jgi:multicomponent K+:H+ antiporter subunit E
MRRLATHLSPVLVLALTCLWLLLNQSFSPGHVLLGLAFALAFAAASAALRPARARMRRLDTGALLILVVLRDIIHGNLSVARLVLGSRARSIRSGFVHIPLDLRDPHGLAALSMIVTATPGTVWAGLSTSGDTLTLHVLDLKDEAEVIRVIKHRYEQPLIRIFQ